MELDQDNALPGADAIREMAGGAPEENTLPVAVINDVFSFKREIESITQRTTDLTIATEADHDLANESFLLARTLEKKIEARRVATTKPLLDEKARIDGRYNELKATVTGWAGALEKKIVAYRKVQREKAEAAERERQAELDRIFQEREKKRKEDEAAELQRRIDAEAEAATIGNKLMEDLGIALDVPPAPLIEEPKQLEAPVYVPPPVEKPANTVKTTSGTVGGKLTWTWELTNINAVPREHFILDEAKISKIVRAGVREIPGIRIFSVEGLAAKTKKGR